MPDEQEMLDLLTQEVTELRAEVANLREGEKKYLHWFEDAPAPLWEQDYSEVKRRVEEIRAGNRGDLETCFHSHPEVVREPADLVRVVDVNKFTLRLYRAESKEPFLSGIAEVFSSESYGGFIVNLLTVAEGKKPFLTAIPSDSFKDLREAIGKLIACGGGQTGMALLEGGTVNDSRRRS